MVLLKEEYPVGVLTTCTRINKVKRGQRLLLDVRLVIWLYLSGEDEHYVSKAPLLCDIVHQSDAHS